MSAAHQQLGLFGQRAPAQPQSKRRPAPTHSAADSLERLGDLRARRKELVELAQEASRARQSRGMADFCTKVRERLVEVRAEEARYRAGLAEAYGVFEDELEDALAARALEEARRDAEEAALAEAAWLKSFAGLAELRAVRAEVVEEFELYEAPRRDLSEAVELGRHLRKKAECRRRAKESGVRLGKITGYREALAVARAAPPPLLAALKAQLARPTESEPRAAAKRIRLRRDGQVVRTVEVAR